MNSASLLKHGVAAVGKQVPVLGPLIDFAQSVEQQLTNEALAKILRAHESDIQSQRAISDVLMQVIAKIQALFQGKGTDEVLRDLVNAQKSGNASALLLPDIFFDDAIRADFLLNLQHAGSDARILEFPKAHDLKLERPDLIHLVINDTRGQLLLCQAPIGFVNMTLGRQQDRVSKTRADHTLSVEPFQGFDFVYDREGVPRVPVFSTSSNTPLNVQAVRDEIKKLILQLRKPGTKQSIWDALASKDNLDYGKIRELALQIGFKSEFFGYIKYAFISHNEKRELEKFLNKQGFGDVNLP